MVHRIFLIMNIFLCCLLIGKPEVERVTPTPHTDPTVPSGIPDICKLDKIDTIVTTKDSRTYVFRESYFWEIGDTGAGKAQKIKDVWKGLDDNLDAAFTRQETGETYFFKGTKYVCFVLFRFVFVFLEVVRSFLLASASRGKVAIDGFTQE